MSFPPCLLVDAVEQFLCQRYAFLTVDRHRAFLRWMPELSVTASLSVNVPSVLLEHPDDFDYFERFHISVLYQRFKDSTFANNAQVFRVIFAVIDRNRHPFFMAKNQKFTLQGLFKVWTKGVEFHREGLEPEEMPE